MKNISNHTEKLEFPRGTAPIVWKALQKRGLLVSQNQVQRVLGGDRSRNTLLGQIIIKKAQELIDINENY